MAWCPHCDHFYDADHEETPCCTDCGHPLACPCRDHHGRKGEDRGFDAPWHLLLWDLNGLFGPAGYEELPF